VKRVRACGEVIGPMPLPEDPAGGPMHKLPRLSWLNWIRLSLIPAGGDWRDLKDVLADGQPRREVFRRHHVGKWEEPIATVAGSGSNGPSAVADPRLTCTPRAGCYGVLDWGEPSRTVIGKTSIDHGPFCVADPRVKFGNVDRVTPWDEPVGTITHAPAPSSGAPAVADPRIAVKTAYDHGYGVLRFDEPSSTIAGGSAPGQGAYSVADLRVKEGTYRGAYGVMRWDEAAGTITGHHHPSSGRFSVADPRKAPPSLVVIIAADGTWHRPLTTLEKAALQGMPTVWKGAPLQLAGTSRSGWDERIGNAVPPPTARAIAESMLVCLVAADVGGFSLSSGGAVWVGEKRDDGRVAA
jgi:site-specific DNA-cytosine methylase